MFRQDDTDMNAAAATARSPLWRRLAAEFLGTGLLVAIVVGSGIAASRLSPDDIGLQLLENSLTTALGLTVLILVLGSVSGAHFNPVVTLADWWLGRRAGATRLVEPAGYVTAQILGGIGGAVLANLMFETATTVSTTQRVTGGHLLGEVVATAGLVLVIFALVRSGSGGFVAPAVGAYIGAAYWFTSSTSFANPAVTIGRVFSDTFAGIAPAAVLPFIGMQLSGGLLGVLLVGLFFPTARPAAASRPD